MAYVAIMEEDLVRERELKVAADKRASRFQARGVDGFTWVHDEDESQSHEESPSNYDSRL